MEDDHLTSEASATETEESPKPSLRDRMRATRARADETKSTLLERAERESQTHGTIRAAFALVRTDRARAGGLLAGGIAYRLFIWLLPAGLAATALLSLFARTLDEPPSDLADSFGMGAALAGTIGQAASQSGRAGVVLFVMGTVLMLWAARSCVKAFRLVSTLAWDLEWTPAPIGPRQMLGCTGILLLFPAYPLVLGPVFSIGPLGDLIATMLAIAGYVALTAWTAAQLPHPEEVRWYGFLPGAAIFAIGLEMMRLAVVLYFTGKLDRVDDLYGAIGLAAVFMTYLYLLARLAVVAIMANSAMWRSHQAPADGAP